jgi:hypothetical protein
MQSDMDSMFDTAASKENQLEYRLAADKILEKLLAYKVLGSQLRGLLSSDSIVYFINLW